MKKTVKYSLIAFITFDVIAAGLILCYLFLAKSYWSAPKEIIVVENVQNDSKLISDKSTQAHAFTEILIEKGQSFNVIVQQLEDADIIDNPLLFKIFSYANKHHNKYLAGYYQFEQGQSPKQVSQKMVDGDVAIFALTFPEGWLSEQIIATIQAEKHLAGEIKEIPSEGSLLPETYHFSHGEERANIIANMQAEMAKTLELEWQNRAENLPYENKEDALIMASIIEKETGVAPEREKIAAVFVNRLKLGMKLQSDPTANYGIYKEVGELKKQLNSKDIEHYSVYNTYIIAGLPATPICNFGRASLHAALNPAKSDNLYFVANGEGGHNFARNLSEHNRNVAEYRRKMQLRSVKE